MHLRRGSMSKNIMLRVTHNLILATNEKLPNQTAFSTRAFGANDCDRNCQIAACATNERGAFRHVACLGCVPTSCSTRIRSKRDRGVSARGLLRLHANVLRQRPTCSHSGARRYASTTNKKLQERIAADRRIGQRKQRAPRTVTNRAQTDQ